MNKKETDLINKYCSKDDIVINQREYNGSFETTGLPLNTKVMYLTSKCQNKAPILLECKVIERIDSCKECTIADFKCNCVDCNLKLIKVYRQ